MRQGPELPWHHSGEMENSERGRAQSARLFFVTGNVTKGKCVLPGLRGDPDTSTAPAEGVKHRLVEPRVDKTQPEPAIRISQVPKFHSGGEDGWLIAILWILLGTDSSALSLLQTQLGCPVL